MPYLNFPGATKAQLVQWRTWAVEEKATGKVNDAWSSGDASGHKLVELSIASRLDMISADLYAQWPDEFPKNVRVMRTVPKFI